MKKHDVGMMIFCDFGVLEGALCGHFELEIVFRGHPGTQLQPEGPSWDPRVVRGWIWNDFGVPLEFTLGGQFPSFSSSS